MKTKEYAESERRSHNWGHYNNDIDCWSNEPDQEELFECEFCGENLLEIDKGEQPIETDYDDVHYKVCPDCARDIEEMKEEELRSNDPSFDNFMNLCDNYNNKWNKAI